MIERKRLARVLLFLAAFVFFSANSVYFIETEGSALRAELSQVYTFDFETIRAKKPYLNLKAAMLVNYENGEVLFAKNADQQRPIASISKLVTAMVVLDKRIDLNRTEKITRQDARRSSRSRLRVGYELTLLDLLYASLMNSDNRAARALARATSGSIEAFADEMNRKCKSLGLKQSVFVEPTGLSSMNMSTAHEVAKIIQYASKYKLIAKISSSKRYSVRVVNRKNLRINMANTNRMVHSPYRIVTGKTGYIQAADYCLTTLLKNKEGETLTMVILGVPGDRLRFREARRLVDWGFRQI